ncbi:MAG: hypothetical protein [Circular genetic element sp.]|nr:MAG: hypothetical protein [Circular genetic element sp.]
MLTLLGHRGWAFLQISISNKRSGDFMAATANKLISRIRTNDSDLELYLDTAAELSKLDRKNHHQVTEKGVPLVYDLMVKVSAPSTTLNTAPDKQLLGTGLAYTCPSNWQTRNATRMTNFERIRLRKEAGVQKGSIGKYAKTMRLNMDNAMFGVTYSPTASLGTADDAPTTQRIYAMHSKTNSLTGAHIPGDVFLGGVWDYTQLAQVESGDANTADPFYVNVCGAHSSAAPGPYTYVSALMAYNQRRQTVRDDATVTSGGDTQFINDDSPFFRIPEQDVSEDKYVEITLDEQDNPPYDRRIVQTTDEDLLADSQLAQPVESFQLSIQQPIAQMRVQAPLGLLRLSLSELLGDSGDNQFIDIEVECLGTYEM